MGIPQFQLTVLPNTNKTAVVPNEYGRATEDGGQVQPPATYLATQTPQAQTANKTNGLLMLLILGIAVYYYGR